MTRAGRARLLANGERRKVRLKRRSPSPMIFTEELLADVRRRYEQTPEILTTMAFDLGIARSTLVEMAKQKGWVRYRPQPRDIIPAAQLAARAAVLSKAATRADPAPALAPSGAAALVVPPPLLSEGVPDLSPDDPALADWLRRELLAQIGVVKNLREQERAEPVTEERALLMARMLVSLTEAMLKLNRFTAGATPQHNEPDDLPEDIDEFRNELARRIRAFVASRTGTGDADGDDANAAMDAAGG